jgi:DNA-directed RNA polymerase III subunit RPC11
MGVNRFECRTCPYEWALEKKWYDRTDMKQKEVEEALGGKDEWKNADSVASKFHRGSGFVDLDDQLTGCSTMPQGRLQWRASILLSTADSQCR